MSLCYAVYKHVSNTGMTRTEQDTDAFPKTRAQPRKEARGRKAEAGGAGSLCSWTGGGSQRLRVPSPHTGRGSLPSLSGREKLLHWVCGAQTD